MNLTLLAKVWRPYRFLIETRPFAVALLESAEAFYGHPWIVMRLYRQRGFMAAIPLTRRTHLFIGVRI
jgi:hypothetical protein